MTSYGEDIGEEELLRVFVVVTAIALLCMQSGSSRATQEGPNPHISLVGG
jgi:hypothetical protein